MSNDNEIYSMKLHQILNANGIYDVLRVPGGWIYMFQDGSKSRVFVPDIRLR